jgi:hypothetical protein
MNVWSLIGRQQRTTIRPRRNGRARIRGNRTESIVLPLFVTSGYLSTPIPDIVSPGVQNAALREAVDDLTRRLLLLVLQA